MVPRGADGAVLVVDDEPTVAAVTAAVLRAAGYRVERASDGASAVAAAATDGLAAIVMDCDMPGVDGPEAARRIRAAEAGAPRLPIVCYAGAPDRERCLAAGMDAVVAKPHASELAATLEGLGVRPGA